MARIEGTDPKRPHLCLMGHTDVVPVTRKTDARPFGGELVNGECGGRRDRHAEPHRLAGVALKTLAGRGCGPRHRWSTLACADEEAVGTLGAGHVVERHWDALRADYCLTETAHVSRGALATS